MVNRNILIGQSPTPELRGGKYGSTVARRCYRCNPLVVSVCTSLRRLFAQNWVSRKCTHLRPATRAPLREHSPRSTPWSLSWVTKAIWTSSQKGYNRIQYDRVKGVHMRDFLKRVWSEEEGQDIAEYAVMLAVILVIVVGTIRLIGGNANNVFSATASSIQ